MNSKTEVKNKMKLEQHYTFSKLKPMDETNIKFVKIGKATRQTKDEILFRINEPIKHDPGQFIEVSILGVGEAPMSICSNSEEYFEMSVRNVGRVTSKICQLKKGDIIGIKGPYGRGYPMEKLQGNNAIIIGGGSGVAPVRGIIQNIINNRDKFKNVNLYFGYRTILDMLFANDFKEWEKHNINIDVIFSEKSTHPKYPREGLITEILEGPNFESHHEKIVFICGPPVMINAVTKKLLNFGFNPDQIFISEERHMKCGVGRCGHCMIGDKYCCTDGPVFRYDELLGEIEGYKKN